MAFIQWNCRGFNTNYNELALLLQEHRPIAVCLQETNLKLSNQIRIANYSQYHCFGPANNGRACWGVSVFVRNGSPHKQITLQTELQAVAVNINAHKSITVCSIYLPPNTPVAIKQIEKLVRQLPKPYILLGDFNAHHTLWGCRDINSYGKIVDQLITQENLCILNDNSQTYLHPGTGSTSAIDLSLCDPSIYMDYTWKVNDDLCGSDHYPILLQSKHSISEGKNQHWQLHKADWEGFQELCETNLTITQFENITVDDPIAHLTTKLIEIAEKTIPKTSAIPKKQTNNWFNDCCRKAIQQRKQALNRFHKHPNRQNLDKYKCEYAKARRTINETKRLSWQNYVSTLNTNTPIKKTWEMIRKINGKKQDNSIKYLAIDSDTIKDKKDIADTLAASFSKKSSPENYSDNFRRIRDMEKCKLDFKSRNQESYNVLSLNENF